MRFVNSRNAEHADVIMVFSMMDEKDMLTALAHPQGMVVGEIAAELEMANSTLSHHLDKLRNEGLLTVQREGTYLRYTAHTTGLEELLGFLYAECCTRNQAIAPQRILCCV